MQELEGLTKKQFENTLKYVDEIINNLPDKALFELLSGYDNDVERLFSELLSQTSKIVNYNKNSIDSEKLGYLSNLEKAFDEQLKIISYNYFKTTCLPNFNQGWRNLEWGNLVQLYPKIAFLCERGAGKSFEFTYAFPIWRLYTYNRANYITSNRDNKNRKETMIITNESTLGKNHMAKVVEEIKYNDILAEKLNPNGKAELNKEGVLTETGSILKLRTFGSSGIRGNHLGACIVDDFLDKSALYSKEQRSKFNEVFYAEILNIVEPQGHLIVSGCVNPDTIVQTEFGLRRIGDLCPIESYKNKTVVDFKESIFGLNGYNNSSKYWCNGKTITNKITTKYGYKLECSEIHPLLVVDEDGVIKWVKSSQIKEGDYIGIKVGSGVGNGNKIKLVRNCSNKIKNKIIHDGYLDENLAYFVGLWIADGSFDKTKSGFTITKNNEGIRNFILSGFNGTKFKVRQKDSIKMDFSSVDMLDISTQVGCNIKTAKYKEVPSEIIKSDETTIKSFIRGMFDGDGNFYQCKNGNNKSVSYSSISEKLIDDLQILLLHLGIVSSKYNKGIGVSKKVVGKNDLFFLSITGADVDIFMDKIGFLYSGKGDNYVKRYSYNTRRYIPFANKLISKIRFENREKLKSRKIKSPIKTNKLSVNHISKDTLMVMNDWFIKNKCEGENLNNLGKLIETDCVWIPVTSIQKGESYTVDFVIPEDHTFVSNGIISHNTPFHEKDLYNDLRNDESFVVFEYPGIMPNGQILAPDRYTFDLLLELKKSLGSIVFSREHLVSPVSDGSSLFPWEFLEKAFVGMENIDLVDNIESFPVKMKKVVVGCDFAVSGKIGADNSVFTVWGVDSMDNYYLIHVKKLHGASHNEQISSIVSIDQRFKPNKIVVESNGFQSILADMAKQRGLRNIETFTTTSGNKKDLYLGLPSLSAMFERGQIKMPYKVGVTQETINWICGEFNSISFNEDSGKLESVGEHDDAPMSSFMAINDLRENKNVFKGYLV